MLRHHHNLSTGTSIRQTYLRRFWNVSWYVKNSTNLRRRSNSPIPNWHNDVVTTLSQRCHNIVARSKMRVVPTSVSNVVTTLLSNVVKTLPQRCYNVATTLSIGLLGHFATDYSDFFPFIET